MNILEGSKHATSLSLQNTQEVHSRTDKDKGLDIDVGSVEGTRGGGASTYVCVSPSTDCSTAIEHNKEFNVFVVIFHPQTTYHMTSSLLRLTMAFFPSTVATYISTQHTC